MSTASSRPGTPLPREHSAGRRALVAGVGNVLRGDDGFGPAVVRALQEAGVPEGVRLIESGIGGINLVLELLDGFDTLVLVDAVDRGGPPGRLFLLEPELPPLESLGDLERYELATDTHQAVPGRMLIVAGAVGALPATVRIVGCQPAETEHFSMALTPPVRAAVPDAVSLIRSLLEEERGER